MTRGTPRGTEDIDLAPSDKDKMEQEEILLPPEDAVPQEDPEGEVPQPPEELEQLRAEKAELEDRNLRLMAEFGNFRNRTAKEKESIYGDAVAGTLRELLPVLDNLERALESPCTDEEYKKGVELIHKGLWEMLANHGVEEIAEAGVPFDPELHNAVMHIEDDSLGKNTVAQVLQKGYRIGGKILRYAMVQAAN